MFTTRRSALRLSNPKGGRLIWKSVSRHRSFLRFGDANQ